MSTNTTGSSSSGRRTRFRLPTDRFVFTGAIPDEELAIYYQHAAVYVSLSEHEGFCVPLLEAMAADVPVLAYAAAAVPDTLGGAVVKFAFIVQRYGAEVLGGSEQLCRLLAERLANQHEVEVLTTCARDYVTWKNEYPEGTDRVRGVTVRRFANQGTRDIAAFDRYSDWIFGNPHSADEEMEWLKQQ